MGVHEVATRASSQGVITAERQGPGIVGSPATLGGTAPARSTQMPAEAQGGPIGRLMRRLLGGEPGKRVAQGLYVEMVRMARSPSLYGASGLGVPDTQDGRFEMILLHVGLIVARLGRMAPDGPLLARG